MSGEWARKCPEALIVSIAPDVCLTPCGTAMVPVPYMIIARLANAEGTDPNHLVCGEPAFTTGSRIPTVEGDEAGTGGGIISGVNRGYCRPIEHSTTFQSGDDWLVREGDLCAMNCAGPEGPANTYGRIVIMNAEAAAPSVTLSKSEATTMDQATGATVVESVEVTENPDTGAVTETRQRTVIDPATGKVTTQKASITKEIDGTKSYQAGTGHFDPEAKRFEWSTTTGDLPRGEVDPDSIEVDEEGRLYLGDEGGEAIPSREFDTNADIPDDDPEVLADPEVMAAQAEIDACEAELEEAHREGYWEGAKLGVDAVGTLDPTPMSDLVGAGMALSDGDWLGAGLSVFAAVLPFAGDAAVKGIKAARAGGRLAAVEAKIQKLMARLAKAKHAIKKAKERVKAAIKKRVAGGKGLAKPKNPGDGGFAPLLSDPKWPGVSIKSGEACRAELKKNLKKAIGEPPAHLKQPHAHHDLPVEFQKEFAGLGININEAQFGRWVEGAPHNKWSGQFSDEWKTFLHPLDDKPNPSRQDVQIGRAHV